MKCKRIHIILVSSKYGIRDYHIPIILLIGSGIFLLSITILFTGLGFYTNNSLNLNDSEYLLLNDTLKENNRTLKKVELLKNYIGKVKLMIENSSNPEITIALNNNESYSYYQEALPDMAP